jgi:hypothetical protein
LLCFILHNQHKKPTGPVYVGKKAVVIKQPDQGTLFAIDGTILALNPSLPKTVQADIRLTTYTATAAKDTVTYTSSKYPTQRFMVVETSPTTWKVIEYTTAKTLPLPSNVLGAKYKLPLGWYQQD